MSKKQKHGKRHASRSAARGPRAGAPAAASGGPMPGQHEFSADEEQAMRQGGAAMRGAGAGAGQPMMAQGGEPDADDIGGMGI